MSANTQMQRFLAAVRRSSEDNATAAIPLSQIGHALSHNWSATVVALALRNVATLRALIDEANP
jgi:hypothetical protein